MSLKPPLDKTDHYKWKLYYNHTRPFQKCECQECVEARNRDIPVYPKQYKPSPQIISLLNIVAALNE
jgi:hypothetical protein